MLRLVALLIALPSLAEALPQVITSEGLDGDARLTLAVNDQAVARDSRSACAVHIVVSGQDVAFRAGDRVTVTIREADWFGDDKIWERSFEAGAVEVAGQFMDRALDCTADLGWDAGGHLELYAKALVRKGGCGLLCRNDRPRTENLDVRVVEDDEQEDDDIPADSFLLPIGPVVPRVARDQDWMRFEIQRLSSLRMEVAHTTAEGPLDVALLNLDSEVITFGEDVEGGTLLTHVGLRTGEYRLRVSPRNPTDFNFYDVSVALQHVEVECRTGAEEDELCRGCGTRYRTCEPPGLWSEMSECAEPPDGCPPPGEGEGEGEGEVDPPVEGEGELPAEGEGELPIEGGGEAQPGPPAIGDACADIRDCGQGLTCIQPPGFPVFNGGYCTLRDCTPGPMGGCGLDASCEDAYGLRLCLRKCTGPWDCRPGHLCAALGEVPGGDAVCVPPCFQDEQCPDPERPRCSPRTGLCAEPGGTGGEVVEEGCGCAAVAPVDPAWGFGLLLLLAVRRRL